MPPGENEKVNIHRAKSSTRSVEQLNRVSNGWENNLSRGNLSKAVSESWGKFGKLKCAHQLVSGLRVKKNHSKSYFSSTLAYSTLFTRKQGHTNHNSSKNEVIKMGSLQSGNQRSQPTDFNKKKSNSTDGHV